MPKLSNFQNDLCNHFNMKNRFCERRMFGWFWVWLYLPQQREYNLCHQSAVSEFYTRLNQTLPYPWAFASVFSVIYVSLQKGLSNASVVELGILSLWIYHTQWVNSQSFHTSTLVLTWTIHTLKVGLKLDKIFLSFYIQMQKNKCCTFITFLNKLHFCNSKNKKKTRKKYVALISEFICEHTFFIIGCTSIWLIFLSAKVFKIIELFDPVSWILVSTFREFKILTCSDQVCTALEFGQSLPTLHTMSLLNVTPLTEIVT